MLEMERALAPDGVLSLAGVGVAVKELAHAATLPEIAIALQERRFSHDQIAHVFGAAHQRPIDCAVALTRASARRQEADHPAVRDPQWGVQSPLRQP